MAPVRDSSEEIYTNTYLFINYTKVIYREINLCQYINSTGRETDKKSSASNASY